MSNVQKSNSSNGENPKQFLGSVSMAYDIDGDGVLDAAEQAMRDMDKTGKGYLTNERVYGLMQEHLDMQKGMFKLKKVIGFLVVLVLLLAVANLGTSFAAAILAKDTTTDDKQNLVSKGSGEHVGTQTTAEVFTVEAPSDQTARRLCTQFGNGKDAFFECGVESFSTMTADDAKNMLKQCDSDKLVRLLKGDVRKTVCNPQWTCEPTIHGKKNDPTSGVLCIEGSEEEVHVYEDPKDSSMYVLSGSSAEAAPAGDSSNYLHMCAQDSDCEDGEVCDYASAGAVAGSPAYHPCTTSADCSGGYLCIESSFDPAQKLCSECSTDADCGEDTAPQCISNQAGGYQCGCDRTDATACGLGMSCGAPICVPDVLPYCSATDHSVDWGCGTCNPAVVSVPETPDGDGDGAAACPEIFSQVCGDGVTYNNQCLAEQAGATTITDGACRGR